MDISIDTIKALRDKTGVSVAQCKKALEETGGDIEKAEVLLRKKSGAQAEKKSDREFGAGIVSTYVHDGIIGGMILLSCETDFVARNPEFSEVAKMIAMQVAATNPSYIKTEDIGEDAKKAATEVFMQEVADKPEEMREKILAGKLASYFRDQVLLEQFFIKDEEKTVRDIITSASQKFGERVEVTQMVRFSVR